MGGEQLEKQIDTKKDAIIEEKELLDFIKDEKNVQELGMHLNSLMPFEKYDNNLYNITQVQIEKQNISIAEKVKNNKAFSIEEKNIVKLQYFLDNKNYTVSETLLDSYIGRKFGNQFYGSNPRIIKNELSPRVTTIEKRETAKTALPNLSNFGKASNSISKMENRYKDNYPNEYKKLQEETQKKTDFYERTHTFSIANIISPIHLSIQSGDGLNKLTGGRGAKEKIEYDKQENRYMMLVQIVNAYAQAQQGEMAKILNIAGRDEQTYKQEADYYIEYGLYCSKNKQVLSDFETQKLSIEVYGRQIEKLLNTYYKGDLEQKKDDERSFVSFSKVLDDKYGTPENKAKLEKANSVLNKDVSTLSGGEEDDINFFLKYMKDVEDTKSIYGSEKIDRYSSYNKELIPLYNNNKSKLQQFESTQKKIDNLFGNAKFDNGRITTFQKISKQMEVHQNNIKFALGEYGNKEKPSSGILEYLVNSSPEFNMLYKAGWQNVDPEAKKRDVDRWYENQSIFVQYAHSIGSSLANVGTNFIGGIGDMRTAAFSALPLGDSWQNSVQCAGYIRNKDIISPVTIQQTSLQTGSIVEDGWFDTDKLTLKFWDAFDGSKVSTSATTWTSQSVSTIANMILLIGGGKMMGGRNIGVNMGKMSFTGTTGLIKMSMLMSVGPSFKKYTEAGFDPQTAALSAFLESGVVSGLELINVGPYFTKNTLKTLFTKQKFLTTILKDLVGENAQELTQTGAEKLMELVTNNIGSLTGSQGNIDVNFTAEEAMNTIILTTIATLIVSGPGNINNVKNNNKSFAYYEKMKAQPALAANFINFINLQKGKNIQIPGLEGPQMVDDILITRIREFLNQTDESTSTNKSKIDPAIVEINSKLNDIERIATAKKLPGLEHITATQEQAILQAHNQDGIINALNFSQIRARMDILSNAGFTSEQIKVLIENGICGQVEVTTLDINQDGKFDKSDVEVISDNNTSQRNFELQTKFEHMGNLQEIYNQKLEAELAGKKESEHAATEQEFKIRWNETLDYFSGENTVKFKGENGLEKGNIKDYGKNLLGEKIYNTLEGKVFFDQLQVYMFYQNLDNPLKYCSHGFDHSILVDAYVQNVIKGTPEVIDKMMQDYQLDREGAILALRLTAVFHDFGYPAIGNLAKSMHGPFGGQLFVNEFTNTEGGKDSFTKLFQEHFGTTEFNMSDLTTDMRDAIFFHSADKVESGYLNKVKYTKGEFLVGDNMNDMNHFLEILDKGGDLEISYRNPVLAQDKSFTDNKGKIFKVLFIDGDIVKVEYKTKEGIEIKNLKKTDIEGRLNNTMLESKRNAELLEKKLIEEHKVDPDSIKVKEDNSGYVYDTEFASDRYQGRKADKKRWDAGIEFKPIDLLADPLAGIVRLADNMDMSLDRLTEIQGNPVFMDLLYNLGIEQNIDNSASNIFQRMEKANKMKKKFKEMKGPDTIEGLQKQINEINKKIPELILDYEQSDMKTDLLIQRDNAKIKLKLINQYNQLITDMQQSINKGIIINDFDYKTGTKKGDINVNVDANTISEIFKDGNIDVNKYKLFVVDQLAKHYNMEADSDLINAINNVAIEEDTGSYSFRHFAGLTTIRDVSLETIDGKGTMIVKVDPQVFFNSDLSSQSVDEGIDIKLNEYHIWRLYDASGRVLVNGKILNIAIVDLDGDQIGYTNRSSATDKFEIIFTKAPVDYKKPEIDEKL